MRVLIVRLSSLGDVVHTIPVAAALRRHFPDATIDWVVDEACAGLLSLVPVIDHLIVLRSESASTMSAWMTLRRELSVGRYDVALDVQGLGKSALVARLSGAARIIGFKLPFLREPWAGWLYNETADPGGPVHVMERNLGILTTLGITDSTWTFPIEPEDVGIVAETRASLGGSNEPFALLNPSSAWANKCWPTDRFGAVAAYIREVHGLRTVVIWGLADEARADAVVASSSGAAVRAPRTNLTDLAALLKAGAFLVSGDTGPLHIAAALGTPVVGVYGPSDPVRNGPWSPHDEVVSVSGDCYCLERKTQRGAVGVVRRCGHTTWCLDGISVDDVCAAVDRRFASVSAHA